MKEVRIIIAGSRNFSDYTVLKKEMFRIFIGRNIKKEQVSIVSGTARGADQLGEKYANEFGLKLIRFPADWSLGKKAGCIRNSEMAKYASEETGILIAFWDGESRGTKSMIDLAKKYGLEVHIINYTQGI